MYWVDEVKNISDIEEFISKNIKTFKKGVSCDFGIYFNGVMIGSGGYHYINCSHRNGEIGYWISKEYEGKGIITKAVKKMVEIGKKKYKLHRVEIRMNPLNERSKSVPKKLGFTHEGTLRDEIIIRSKFRSTEIWSLLV